MKTIFAFLFSFLHFQLCNFVIELGIVWFTQNNTTLAFTITSIFLLEVFFMVLGSVYGNPTFVLQLFLYITYECPLNTLFQYNARVFHAFTRKSNCSIITENH